MTKRLNDTSALTAQGIKPAGNEYASCKSPHWDEPNPLEPAYQSADYAVEAEKRRKEREERMNNPLSYTAAPSERAEYQRKTGAGNSSLSAAVKIARGE